VGVQQCGLGARWVGGSPCSPPLPQVLILELSKVLRPAQLTLRGGTEEPTLTLTLVCPTEEVGMGLGELGGPQQPTPRLPLLLQKAASSWTFAATAIRGVR